MESIDALIFMVFGAVRLVFIAVITYWYIALPLAVLIGICWYLDAKCPHCGSLVTHRYEAYSRHGGYRRDWVPVIDPVTRDWYAERFNRTCDDCKRRWLSEESSDLKNPRPARKKILDWKTHQTFKKHHRKKKGRPPFD